MKKPTACKHQFIKVRDMERPENMGARMVNDGIEVACALCGEIRHLQPDGTVRLVREGHSVIMVD